jgi:hypothetical protein
LNDAGRSASTAAIRARFAEQLIAGLEASARHRSGDDGCATALACDAARTTHASVAFTLDTHAHLMPGQQADAAAAVAALVDAL